MRTRALHPDEIALLESALLARGQYRNRLFLVLAAMTGFRVSELVSIRWRDLLTATGDVTSQLTIERRALKGGRGVHRKSIRSRRVPLGNRSRAAIADYLADLGAPPSGDAFVFQSRNGDNAAITRGKAFRWLKRLARELGLDATRISPHALRRTFAAAAYNVSRDLLVVQKLLCHVSPLTTALYLETSAEQLDAVVLSLDCGAIPAVRAAAAVALPVPIST
jgi:integrase/recombinase XerD